MKDNDLVYYYNGLCFVAACIVVFLLIYGCIVAVTEKEKPEEIITETWTPPRVVTATTCYFCGVEVDNPYKGWSAVSCSDCLRLGLGSNVSMPTCEPKYKTNKDVPYEVSP